MRIRGAVLVALAAAMLLPAAPARADLAGLEASCTGTMRPVDVRGQPLTGLGYRFCDDGVPPVGGTTPNPAGTAAIKVPAAYRYPAGAVPPGVSDPTVDGLPPKDPAGATTVGGADPGGDVALDADLTLPTLPPPPGGYPLIVMMHGCCSGNKTSWESGTTTQPGSIEAGGERWHYDNVWFASRGYVVLTYTSRGFVNGNGQGSTGDTQIDSLQYEINDLQYLAGLLADDPSLNVDPQKVVVTGGSYGGGFSWLAFTDPLWKSPGGRDMKLAAVAPKYGWTDLVYSLIPTGRQFFDYGSPPATDGSDSGIAPPGASPGSVPAGIPIRSIIAGLYLSGKTGLPPGNHATFTSQVDQSFQCTQTFYPLEDNPACTTGGALSSVFPDFLAYRSAYYRNAFFAKLAADPAYRTPVFSAGTETDPLFPPIEHHRMAARLRATVPNYPIQEYYGDYQHFTQNKAKEWGDTCGDDHHVCTAGDYPNGDLNATPSGLVRTGITTRLNRFIDFYAKPPGDPSQRQPRFDVTASLQVCPQNVAGGQRSDDPGETFTAATYNALTPGLLGLDLRGDQATTSKVAGNEHAASADPIGNSESNGGRCPVESTPAGPGVAVYDSQPLPSRATMIGGTVATVRFAASSANGLQLDARMYDVFPDGTAVMVDRGPRRVSPAEAARGQVVFQLHGNGWRFEPGHRIRIELTQDDDPYLKSSDEPSTTTVSEVALRVPLRETTYGLDTGGAVPAGVDRIRPRARMLAPGLASNVSTSRRFRIRWRGTDFGSGIASFRLEVRRVTSSDRARRAVSAWRTLARATRRNSMRFRGAPGATYRFRVLARDRARNVSRWAYATTVVPTGERLRAARYRGPWRLQRSRGAFGGRVIACSSRRCSVRLRYRGATFWLIGRAGPDGGRARVTVDGRRRTVDLYAPRVRQRRVLLRVRRRLGRHRVTIRVLHGRRRAASGYVVALDGFGLSALR